MVVVVEVLTDMAKVRMGEVLEDQHVGVVVHKYWEGYMMVA